MFDNITFVDLVALMRITSDSTVEKFGGLINSSFFDASNILGSLKQKGLVDFVTSFPNQSAITVTEQGKQLISEVQQKASTPFDTLDMSVLVQLANGKRTLSDVANGVNVTQKDLATHLYKLSTQQYMSYELRNGNMNMTLTEKGFLCVKEGKPQETPATAQQPTQSTSQTESVPNVSASQTPQQELSTAQVQTVVTAASTEQAVPKTVDELKALDEKIARNKRIKWLALLVVSVVVFVAAFVLLLYYLNLI